jgi:GMP synthase-like glutamine amidotransferase
MVFGGSAQLDEPHGWLAGERAFAGDLLDRGVPVLGVCLGGQLLAQAAGADVGPARVPEVGWHQVELTPDARDDPLLAGLPRRFEAFQWHSYGFGLPDDAFALAYGPGDALQACRVGESAWAIQFHAEVTHAILGGWIEEDGGRELGDPGALLARSQASMPRWNELGRALCGRFLEFAEGAGR